MERRLGAAGERGRKREVNGRSPVTAASPSGVGVQLSPEERCAGGRGLDSSRLAGISSRTARDST